MTPNTQPTVQSQMNVNGLTNSNSGELMDYTAPVLELIPNTPLYVEGNERLGYCVVMRNAQLTERFKTKDECIQFVYEKPYSLLITIMTYVCDTYAILKHQDNERTTGEKGTETKEEQPAS